MLEIRMSVHVKWPERGADPWSVVSDQLGSTCNHALVCTEAHRGWVSVSDEAAAYGDPHITEVAEKLSAVGPCVAFSVESDREFGVLLAVHGDTVSRLSSAPSRDLFGLPPLGDRETTTGRPNEMEWSEALSTPLDRATFWLFEDPKSGSPSVWVWAAAAQATFGLAEHWWADWSYQHGLKLASMGESWCKVVHPNG